MGCFPILEAVTEGVFWEKVFLEISQNSQENTCAKVAFLRIQLRFIKADEWYCYSLRLWVGYFIYFKITCVFFYLMVVIIVTRNVVMEVLCCNGGSTSIKEISTLIWKGMSNVYFWKKLTFSKLRFSRKENLKKCTNFEEQKGTRYIRGNIYISINAFTCFSSTKSCLRFLLICFAWEVKGFYQSSFGNEIDFKDIMNVSLNILAKN